MSACVDVLGTGIQEVHSLASPTEIAGRPYYSVVTVVLLCSV